jgi:hypothetical protein
VSSLLAVLIAFVGAILVLALAAQSIQELLKVIFAIKGHARLQALRGLLVESARSACQSETVGLGILESTQERLRNLGQAGMRSRAVRIDHLTREDLAGLIRSTDSTRTAELSGLGKAEREEKLDQIARQATAWFDLALAPVDERYRRRMRVWALLSSAIVVLGLNADAIAIFREARADPAFRARMDTVAAALDSLRSEEQRLEAGLAAAPDTQAAAGTDTAALRASLTGVRARRDTLVLHTAWGGTFLSGARGPWRWRRLEWWLGILASILLVSLGAPFWHDLLEALFGLKNRIRAEAQERRRAGGGG